MAVKLENETFIPQLSRVMGTAVYGLLLSRFGKEKADEMLAKMLLPVISADADLRKEQPQQAGSE